MAILSSSLPAAAFLMSFGGQDKEKGGKKQAVQVNQEPEEEEQEWGALDLVAGFSALALLFAALYGIFLSISVR